MRLLTTGIILLISTLMIGQSLSWSEPIEVADGFGNLRPRLALTNGDIPVIVWGGGLGSQPVYVSRWNGNAFGAPLAVSPDGFDPYCASWTGPDIASVGNDVWVVFDGEVGNDFRVFTVKSTDGGVSFSDTVNVGGYSGITRFPAIGVADFANPVVAFMDHDPGYANPRYMASTSDDGGLSWQTPVNGSTIISGDEVCDCCPPEVVTDGQNQILMFRNNDENLRDMWATVSNDNGLTYTKGSDVDEAGWTINACPSTGPDGFIKDDSVVMVWSTGGYGSPNRLMLTSVSKTTGIGGDNQMISPFGAGKQDYPRIHGSNEVVGVVFQENVGGSYDCLFSFSTDGSTNFEFSNITINEETEGSQTNPDVIYSNGVFHFTWQDGNTGNVIYRTATLDEVGIKEQQSVDFDIFPNPAQHTLNLRLPIGEKINEILIYSSSNRIVNKSSLHTAGNTAEIDISGLAAGVYSINVTTENSSTTKVFLKTK